MCAYWGSNQLVLKLYVVTYKNKFLQQIHHEREGANSRSSQDNKRFSIVSNTGPSWPLQTSKDFQGSKGSPWLKGFKSLPELPRASERLEPLDGELKASTPAPAVQVLAKDVEVAWQGSLNIVVGCQDSRPWIDTNAWECRAAARNPFCPQKLSAPKTCYYVVEYFWMKSSTGKCIHAVAARHWAFF